MNFNSIKGSETELGPISPVDPGEGGDKGVGSPKSRGMIFFRKSIFPQKLQFLGDTRCSQTLSNSILFSKMTPMMELQKIREPQLLGAWRRAAAKSKVHDHRFA